MQMDELELWRPGLGGHDDGDEWAGNEGGGGIDWGMLTRVLGFGLK